MERARRNYCLVFPLAIDVNDALNYHTNYIQCKCGKKSKKAVNKLPGVRPF